MNDRKHADGGHEPVARALGQTLATIQHLLDLGLSWGFKSLKKVSAPVSPADAKVGCAARIKRAGRRALHFFGAAGDSYYEWYEGLKARRK